MRKGDFIMSEQLIFYGKAVVQVSCITFIIYVGIRVFMETVRPTCMYINLNQSQKYNKLNLKISVSNEKRAAQLRLIFNPTTYILLTRMF